MKARKLLLLLGVFCLFLCGCGKKDESVDSETGTTEDEFEYTEVCEEGLEDPDAPAFDEDFLEGAVASGETVLDNYQEIHMDGKLEKFDKVAMIDGAGFEYYSYKEGPAEAYADVINACADKYAGKAEVYTIVVPLGSGICFPDNMKNENVSSDQGEAIRNIGNLMNSKVHTINPVNALLNHRTEYLYFRTDHHWTQLGAYYAYTEFCKAKGIEAAPIDAYETNEFDGFLGSFYKDTNNSSAMSNNKDMVRVFYPMSSSTSMHVTEKSGREYDWDVIHDVSGYKAGVKYSAFVAGDNPISVIKNNDLTDGSACVVLKESYGNALVPFLVDNYETIYLVDYRYFEGDISKYIDEGATDIIFINNLTMIRNKGQIGLLENVLK